MSEQQRTEPAPRTAAQEALDEFDNIRWDDIWQRVDASGEDDLARWSKKYAGYVRSALVRAAEQSVPPLDVETALRVMDKLIEIHDCRDPDMGVPCSFHAREHRLLADVIYEETNRLIPQPAFDNEPSYDALSKPARPAVQPSASGDTGLREALERIADLPPYMSEHDARELYVEALGIARAALASQPSERSEP